jgi:antitoxin Phd
MHLSQKGRVLIVENGRFYSHQLSEAGFKVSEASGAKDAIRQVESEEFDLLISDFKLPQMDGLTLLRHIREHFTNLQMVLMLEFANNQIALQAAELGVFQSLVKPIKPDILVKAASLAMRRQREHTSSWKQAQRSVHSSREATSVTATEAKKEFGRVLEKVIQGTVVMITKHDDPKAVLISMDEFNTLRRASEIKINSLSAEFDVLLARMQRPGARASMQVAFNASSKQLGKIAVAAARKRE